jgi:acetyl esterase/lipase
VGWNALFNPDPEKTHADTLKLLAHFKLSVTEATIEGVHCYVIVPTDGRMVKRRLLMHLHGGAYTARAGENGIKEAILVAGATRVKTISVDYRMPPDYPYPAPLDDASTVWKAVSAQERGSLLGMFGSSTGGAMVLAVTQRAIAEHFRVPDAIFAGTPWSDLSETGDSYFTNRYADPIVYRGDLSVSAGLYANGLDLKDPKISPVYGSFEKFPPTLLLSGTRDLFLSNTVRVDRRLRNAGRHSELIVYEGESHGAYLLGVTFPETITALNDISEFFSRELRYRIKPNR